MPIIEGTGQPIFATAFFAFIDTHKKTLTYSNAGHPAPLLLRSSNNKIEQLGLKDPEPATGLIEGFEYSHYSIPFNSLDTLIAFTDGIIEAADAKGIQFGEANLISLIENNSALILPELLNSVIEKTQSFSGKKEFDDDICIIAAKLTAH
jgi:sigma-B regulation protein RsbU (phosphoserine phosphatase)